MKNKSIQLCIVLICVIFVCFSGIAFASGPEIQLKYGSYAPRNVIDDPIFWFFEEVSKRSGVEIKLETYHGSTLAKPQDCLDAIGIGVYDVGWISPVFTPGKTPLALIPNATPLVINNLESGMRAADELAQKFPPAADEYKAAKVHFLFHSGVEHYNLISKKPVTSLDDIKGLRVRTFGYLSKAWAELGGTPVAIPIPEIYSALQKGTIDAVLTQPISMYKSLRLCEVAKNYTKVDFGCLVVPVIMNVKTWNKLPENVKKTMATLSNEMPGIAGKMISQKEMDTLKIMEKEGIRVAELSEPDIKMKKSVAEKITQIVVNDLNGKGVKNAGEAMKFYLSGMGKGN